MSQENVDVIRASFEFRRDTRAEALEAVGLSE
jgi:hypothetical protein